MLEVLQFIFSKPWIWLGTLTLLVALCSGVAKIVLAVRGVEED